MNTYNEIQQKIADCRWKLSDSASPIGDWKIAKCYEYALMGLPAPYDITELSAKRQAVRDEINDLEEKLKKFDIPVVRKSKGGMKMSMNIKTYVCAIIGAIGGAVSAALGGWDNAIITLIIFMTADFILGLANAMWWHKSDKSENGALSSRACWQGIVKKFGTLVIVVCANYADKLLNVDYLRDAVIIAFCASELISICETAGLMGILPSGVQKILSKIIDLLNDKSGGNSHGN